MIHFKTIPARLGWKGVGIGMIVLLSSGLRWCFIKWGFPLKYAHIDESVVLFYALRVVDGALTPGFHDYPNFFLYLVAATIRGLHGLAQLFGALPPLAEMFGHYSAGDSRWFLWVARSLSALAGTATVGYVVWWGHRKKMGLSALGAGLLLSLNGLHLLHSHYGTVDVTAAFLVLWALDRWDQFCFSANGRNAVWFGSAVGLAAATKYYPGVLILLPLLNVRAWADPGRVRLLVGVILSSVVVFSLASPGTVLALPEFWERFQHLAPKIVGAPGGYSGNGFLIHLWRGLGAVVFLSALGGAFLCLREKGEWRPLIYGTGLLGLFLVFWRTQSAHYALGLYPVAVLMAARALAWVGRNRWGAICVWSIALGLTVPSAVGALRVLSERDTRLVAGDWVRNALPAGSHVYRFAHTPEFRPTDPFSVRVDFTNNALRDAESLAQLGSDPRCDFILYSSFSPVGDPNVKALSIRFRLVKSFETPAPRFPHHPAVYVFSTHD